MPVPDFQSIMLPLLNKIRDGQEHSLGDVVAGLAADFNLSEEELNEPLPSGKQPKFRNRVGWSRTYLKKAGLLEYPGRATMKITQRGSGVLEESPALININFLKRFPEFKEFRELNKINSVSDDESVETEEVEEDKTPDEMVEIGYNLLRADLAQELLDKLRLNSPAFFEKVVLDILSLMGYGEGEVSGRSGDGGVDGFVNQDKLGLDKIVFQAKRYADGSTVGSGMIRDFIGSLDIHRVNKGVFITTSKFSSDALDVVQRSQKSVVLIDGKRLVNLMIDYGLGVSLNKKYEIKDVDSDYFSED